ncbi:chromate transporter [Salsuginibacillus halophilus]|uniref:Chromate transporter n=1 Tax=Salsuginibacillus halophilus TaxID=517424 RepID=A0A2P8HQM3_9BACI|nr:chromate transporter [Salsuginibacillus halophilus]PSL48515.1 chromate transporter [Salsuginibacillus halophilus]
MVYWDLFVAFFIPGIVGYGGGPASIPLVEYEVVQRYEWMTTQEFGEVLALGNALPGPIATKMAGFIGYEVAGAPGAVIALFATVGPSLLAMLLLVGLLMKFKESPRVKRMTSFIRPVIAVLLGALAVDFFATGQEGAGWIQTGILAVGSYILLEVRKVHPAFVILFALAYGAIFLSW